MNRRIAALVLTAVATGALATAAAAEEPQDFCVGTTNTPAYCVGSEDGFVKLPPIGTSRVRDLLNNG